MKRKPRKPEFQLVRASYGGYLEVWNVREVRWPDPHPEKVGRVLTDDGVHWAAERHDSYGMGGFDSRDEAVATMIDDRKWGRAVSVRSGRRWG